MTLAEFLAMEDRYKLAYAISDRKADAKASLEVSNMYEGLADRIIMSALPFLQEADDYLVVVPLRELHLQGLYGPISDEWLSITWVPEIAGHAIPFPFPLVPICTVDECK